MSLQRTAAALHTLDAAETNDPMLVIDELFDFSDLPGIRELMWDWLKATVTCTYHKELPREERTAIIALYEKMEKLVEAAYLIKQQNEAKE